MRDFDKCNNNVNLANLPLALRHINASGIPECINRLFTQLLIDRLIDNLGSSCLAAHYTQKVSSELTLNINVTSISSKARVTSAV